MRSDIVRPHQYMRPGEFVKVTKPIVALDDGEFELLWSPDDCNKLLTMWARGIRCCHTIGAALERDPDEVAVGIIEFARRRRIDSGGVRW